MLVAARKISNIKKLESKIFFLLICQKILFCTCLKIGSFIKSQVLNYKKR